MLLNFKSGKRTDADRKEAGYDKGRVPWHTDKDAHMMQWAISLFFRRKRKIAGIMKWLLHSRNYQNKIKHKKFMWQ